MFAPNCLNYVINCTWANNVHNTDWINHFSVGLKCHCAWIRNQHLNLVNGAQLITLRVAFP